MPFISRDITSLPDRADAASAPAKDIRISCGILALMTTADIAQHWRNGSAKALRVAKLAHKDGAHELALFPCHLAIEKALKAAIMEKTKKPHPKIHSLWNLAVMLSKDWSEDDKELFDTLSDFAVAARYDDPQWAKECATAKIVERWIKRTGKFLSSFLP